MIDVALCMTVFPGSVGQAFIPESAERIRKLRALIDRAILRANWKWTAASITRLRWKPSPRGHVAGGGDEQSPVQSGPAAAVREIAPPDRCPAER